MNTNMRDTSLDAYKSIKPKLQAKEKMVLGALIALKGNATNQEIADYLGWPINRITGRTFTLREAGIIREGQKVKSPTGRMAQRWIFNSLQLKLL